MLYSYFIYTGKLFLRCTVFVACCNIIRALWESKKEERLSCRKRCKEEFVWGRSLFWLHALPTMFFFCCFLRLLSFPSDVLAVWPQWKYIIFLWLENLLEFNNSWLASPGMWSYFRLFLASVILAMTLN